MNQTNKNIKICERLGFERVRLEKNFYYWLKGSVRFSSDQLPDHLACLNAMRSAKMNLSEDKRHELFDQLCKMHHQEAGPMSTILKAVDADAEHQAEAFGIVCGLWEDGE